MAERDDSGMIPLTRDGGYRMIQQAIKEFEGNVWVPAVKDLGRKIDANDEKTDRLLLRSAKLHGAVWGVGLMLAIPGLVWTFIQIYQATK